MSHLCAFLLRLSLGLAAATAAAPAMAQEDPPVIAEPQFEPMILGVASTFSQGSHEIVWKGLEDFPLREFRAGLRWSEIERRHGQYTFRRARHLYPERLQAMDAKLVLTLNFGNPLYDDGHTPHSAEAVVAFGRFAAAMVERFPAITTVEIGNEFNGNNFVNGPVRDAGLAQRGTYHLAMLRSAAEAVRAVRPDVEILGGATHSIPAGYLWPILDAGGGQWMDGLAIHPYTTPIDQLPAQIGVLRRHPIARGMPIWVTEWGSENARLAPHELVQGYVTMAALGFRALYWYPLTDRGDGLVPLLDNRGEPTQTGEAFAFVQGAMAGKPVTDISPDAFTSLYAIGDDMLVIWGEERSLTLRGDAITVRNARGAQLEAGQFVLSRERPLVLSRNDGLDPARDLVLGCQPLIADTRRQFAFPPETTPDGTGFSPSVVLGEVEQVFTTMPGQQRGGVLWVPYLGLEAVPRLRLTASSMLPAGRAGQAATIIHRFTATAAMEAQLDLSLAVAARSEDGVSARLTRNGVELRNWRDTRQVDHTETLALDAGDEIAILVNGGTDTTGDSARYRFRLHDVRKCKGEPPVSPDG